MLGDDTVIIGIDVGGTYTDAVLIKKDALIKKHKTPTRHDNLLESLLKGLDFILEGEEAGRIERIVVSTTLITNVIAENKYKPVAMVLMPGPGLNPKDYPFAGEALFIRGAIDFRGKEIQPLDQAEILATAKRIRDLGYEKAAVVGKFSSRNNTHEEKVKERLAHEVEGLVIETGHQVSGLLNFPRRVATTMLTAATKTIFADFCTQIKDALSARQITAPIYILKADGGTLPLDGAVKRPVETILSGPAASTLGAIALAPPGQTMVVLDIGGTTTDLSLVLSGEPLAASKGAEIKGHLTDIKAFATRSVPIGGDSTVVADQGRLNILTSRQGPAYCLGGPAPTPTDALRFLGKIHVGDGHKAAEAINRLAEALGKSPQDTAAEILDNMRQKIVKSISRMVSAWEQEPAYRVWEVVQQQHIKPETIVGVGGGASGIIPQIAGMMNCSYLTPLHAEVANAIGAAVAQPTVSATIRIDTEKGLYSILEEGTGGTVPCGRSFTDKDALALARKCLLKRAETLKILQYVETQEMEVSLFEVFNLVRDWETTGKIFDIRVQTPPAVLTRLKQEEAKQEGKR